MWQLRTGLRMRQPAARGRRRQCRSSRCGRREDGAARTYFDVGCYDDACGGRFCKNYLYQRFDNLALRPFVKMYFGCSHTPKHILVLEHGQIWYYFSQTHCSKLGGRTSNYKWEAYLIIAICTIFCMNVLRS